MIAAIGEGARVAWLVGPEGVGKSALARRSSNTSRLPVIRVDVYPEDREAPLSTAGELAASLGVSLGEDPAQDLLRALESLGPAVIIIEDAQWMDQASQVAIWQVVRRFRRLPICLIVTSTHATGTLLDGLGLLLRSPERGQVLKVEPMAVGETAALLKAELGVPIEGETLDLVQAVTGGYATLLDSLVTQVRLGGPDVTVRSALQSLTNSDQGGALLRQHVVGALGTLPAGARGALLALAQSGQLTTPQLTHLLRLRGLPDTDTGSLLATGLVERAPADALRLRHRLAARVIRDAVPWTEARLSHAALAGTLTGLEGLEHRVAAIDAAEVPEVAAELHGQLVGAYIANDLTLALRVARHASRLDPAMKIEVVLAALRSGRPSRLMDVADVVATMAASPPAPQP
ncbi:ATP-binding protein [Tessaracoccus sp. HDW20]|uniref:AAA family ATPase n=1 Tax=Tessaracoccus coleopterorum TaxID=2714950 RepID=UPI0018D3AEEE|nr:AAA family ATPase [Tessaracoccus coleopterorum]NHB84574.1 ATP-binding protein [Tessaracoccus coleopterorum]